MDRGHKLEDIRGYSVPKFRGFLESINDLEKDEVKQMALASRIAQAEKKDFEKFLKE